MTSAFGQRPASQTPTPASQADQGSSNPSVDLRARDYASAQEAVRPRSSGTVTPEDLAGVPTSEGVSVGAALLTANGGIGTAASAAETVGDVAPALRVPGTAGRAIHVTGNVTGGLSLAADALDIMQNGLNVQNGVTFVVDAASVTPGVGTNPVVAAFCIGYGLGQFLDDIIGISDWVGSLANRGHAGGNLERLHAVERLAGLGDRQCQRLIRLYRSLADYEDTGAGLANRAGADAATADPELLQEVGRAVRVRDRTEELVAGGDSRFMAGLRASMQTALPDTLRDQIEEENDILDDRIAEARDLVRRLSRPAPQTRTGGRSSRPQM